jgi:hypothetical protein
MEELDTRATNQFSSMSCCFRAIKLVQGSAACLPSHNPIDLNTSKVNGSNSTFRLRGASSYMLLLDELTDNMRPLRNPPYLGLRKFVDDVSRFLKDHVPVTAHDFVTSCTQQLSRFVLI